MDRPLCCRTTSLQTGAKAISILQTVGATVTIIVGIWGLVFAGNITFSGSVTGTPIRLQGQTIPKVNYYALRNYPDFAKNGTNVLLFIPVVTIITGFINLALSITLYDGASNRIPRKCRIWLMVESMFLVLVVIVFLTLLSVFDFSQRVKNCIILIGMIGITIGAYCIWVVYELIQEIRIEREESRRRGWEMGPSHGPHM